MPSQPHKDPSRIQVWPNLSDQRSESLLFCLKGSKYANTTCRGALSIKAKESFWLARLGVITLRVPPLDSSSEIRLEVFFAQKWIAKNWVAVRELQ